MDYLQNPSNKAEFKLKQKALKYTMNGDELYIRSFNGVQLKCVNQVESMRLMREIHERLCGAHRFVPIMKSLIIKHGFYWPIISNDCYQYAKGCEECKDLGLYKRLQQKKCMQQLSLGHLEDGPWMLSAKSIKLHLKDIVSFWQLLTILQNRQKLNHQLM